MVSSIRIIYCILCGAVVAWNLHPFLINGSYSRTDHEWNNPGIPSAINDDAQAMGLIENSTNTNTIPIIDILSTGSMNRPDYQVAQEAFLREHPSVRHYFAMTELNDTESECHSQLNWTQVVKISRKCRSLQGKLRAPFLARLVQGFVRVRFLQKKANPMGWMCAQKRPLTSLWQILQGYDSHDFPDYLFLIDDDTWIQMDTLVPTLTLQYPSHLPYFIAGCPIRFKRDHNFSFPFGGYGMIFTKAALYRWSQPLKGCHPFLPESSPTDDAVDQNDFVSYACNRLHRHHQIGERMSPQLFSQQQHQQRDMTVADIFYSYVHRANYTNVEKWDGIGYCLHSDWALGYFASEYRISMNGQLQGFHNSSMSKGVRTGECLHRMETECYSNATICHYMTPKGMRERMKNVTRTINTTSTIPSTDG